MAPASVNPITVEVVRNGLAHIANEMATVLRKTSYNMVSHRLTKHPVELEAMRAAGRLLNTVCSEVGRFIKPGRKEYEIVADIDRLARDHGAEDIRILVGETRLNPPSFKRAAGLGNQWAVYLAVQHDIRFYSRLRSSLRHHSAARQRAEAQTGSDSG